MVLLLRCTFAEVCAAEETAADLWQELAVLHRPVFHNPQQVGHHWLFFPHVDFVHAATLGNWSQNSGVGRLIISLAFLRVCAICLEGGGGSVNYLQVYISPRSSPEWLWKLFLGWFSETAKSLSIVETVLSTQISKKHTVGGYCYWRVCSPQWIGKECVRIRLRNFLLLQLGKQSIFIAMDFILNCLFKDHQKCHFTCLRYKKLEKLECGKQFPFFNIRVADLLILEFDWRASEVTLGIEQLTGGFFSNCCS